MLFVNYCERFCKAHFGDCNLHITINTCTMNTHSLIRETRAAILSGISVVTAFISLAGAFAFTVAGSNAYGQMYHYEFSVEGITDPASAKELTDVLRLKFNEENNPLEVYPAFDDLADAFDFHSDVLVNRDELEELLERENYVLNGWKLSEKRKEE